MYCNNRRRSARTFLRIDFGPILSFPFSFRVYRKISEVKALHLAFFVHSLVIGFVGIFLKEGDQADVSFSHLLVRDLP